MVAIDGQPLDAARATAHVSSIDRFARANGHPNHLSTQDSAGKFVFVATPGIAADAVFGASFYGRSG